MSVLDQFALRAPGVATRGLAGKREGEAQRRQQEIEDEKREREAQQVALEMHLLRSAEKRANELHPANLESIRALTTDRLRPPAPPAPRNIDPNSPEGIEARLDYDRRRVRPRAGSGRPGGLTDTQREQRAVAGQIDDTRSDLARAERESAPRMTRPAFLPKEREGQFVADSTAAARKIGGLQQRADSLTAVNDQLVARMRDGDGGGTRPSFSDVGSGGSSGPAPQGDIAALRAQARDAIERGAPVDAVRARFKKLTGQDL